MSPLKASGIDGICAAFFQTNWDVVKDSVCAFVRGALDGGSFDESICKAVITLVPKKGVSMFYCGLSTH